MMPRNLSSPMRSKDYTSALAGKGVITPKAKSMFTTPDRGNIANEADALSPKSLSSMMADAEEAERGPEIKVEDQFCGRIRFTDIPLPLNAPTDLICEECEDRIASFYCAGCKEVFCPKCADFCHPRISAQVLMHEHEKSGWIRPLEFGDTSKIKKTPNIYPPDTLCYYEDWLALRESAPELMVVNSSPPKRQAVTRTQESKFAAHSLVLFMDPTGHEEAYGKVISQWEQVHSQAAPAIVRGDSCTAYYYVQMLGLSKDIGDPVAFVQKYKAFTAPTMSASSSAVQQSTLLPEEDLAEEKRMARNIDKKLQDMRNVQVLGPKHHLRDVTNRELLVPQDLASSSGPTFLTKAPDNKYIGHIASSNQLSSEDRLANHYQEAVQEVWGSAAVDMNLYADIDDHKEASLHVHSLHREPMPAMNRSYLDYLHNTSSTSALDVIIVPENAMILMDERIRKLTERKRYLMEKVFLQRNSVVTNGIVRKRFLFWKRSLAELKLRKMHYCARRIQTMARVWLCRNELEYCRDYWANYHEQKRLQVHNQFRRATADDPAAVSFDNQKYFATYADVNRYSHFLRIVCNRVSKFLNRKRRTLLRKTVVVWRSAIYDFCEQTMQNNHINEDLIAQDLQETIRNGFDKTFSEVKESIVEHHRQIMEDPKAFDGMQHDKISALPLRTAELSPYFCAGEMTVPPFSPGNDGNDDLTEASTPTIDALDSKRQWGKIPMYDPAADVDFLPPLLPISRPKTFRDRLYYDISLTQKALRGDADSSVVALSSAGSTQGEDAWKHASQGPTSDSFWLIPNILIVGQAPFGVAERKHMMVVSNGVRRPCESVDNEATGPVEGMKGNTSDRIDDGRVTKSSKAIALTAISALLLQGVNTFVSLLTADEERLLEELYQTEPIQVQIEQALTATRANANDVICYNQEAIAKQERIIAEMPYYGKTDPRYPAAHRQRMRCEARMELAKSNIARIKRQITKLPERISWTRLTHLAERKQKCTIDDLLPSVWQIEEFIRQHKCCYIYSYGVHINNKHIQPDASVYQQMPHYNTTVTSKAKNRDMVCVDDSNGCLAVAVLGRLYHLEPYDAMFRWQKAHDTMRSLAILPNIATQTGAEFRLSCPNLPWQKNLIIELLKKSHYPLEYPVIRGQTNPDTFTELYRDGYDETLRNQTITKFTARSQSCASISTVTSANGSMSASSMGKLLVQVADDDGENLEEASRQEEIMAGMVARSKQSLYFG